MRLLFNQLITPFWDEVMTSTVLWKFFNTRKYKDFLAKSNVLIGTKIKIRNIAGSSNVLQRKKYLQEQLQQPAQNLKTGHCSLPSSFLTTIRKLLNVSGLNGSLHILANLSSVFSINLMASKTTNKLHSNTFIGTLHPSLPPLPSFP